MSTAPVSRIIPVDCGPCWPSWSGTVSSWKTALIRRSNSATTLWSSNPQGHEKHRLPPRLSAGMGRRCLFVAETSRGEEGTYLLVEGVTTGAGGTGIRVVDGEALGLDRVREVDLCAEQVWGAHLVHDQTNTSDNVLLVAVEGAVVEVELVTQTGTAAWLHCDAQGEVIATLLVNERLRL